MAADRIKVWDPLVRCFHWLLVTGFIAGYFTRHSSGSVHEWVGYALLVLLAIRLLWGFFGPRRARFSNFLRQPVQTITYSRLTLSGKQPRYVGHNPLGGWMAVLLIFFVFATCASGWLYTTDRFWGIEWVEDLHNILTWITVGLVVVHVLGVIHASRHSHENLLAAMIHGRKRPASGTDVD